VKQTFPYVKVHVCGKIYYLFVISYFKASLMHLHDSGNLDGWNKRIIASDGGPGHFKVYKTQYWMSKWCSELSKKSNIYTEWNMFFANLGHNVCDSHAGHMKRYLYMYIILIIFL
jgi:hypothetical protein